MWSAEHLPQQVLQGSTRARIEAGSFGATANNAGNAYSMHGSGRADPGLGTHYPDSAYAAQDDMLMYRQPIAQHTRQPDRLAAGGAISVPTGSASAWVSRGAGGSLDGSQHVRIP